MFLKVVHLGPETRILVLGKAPGWRFVFDPLRSPSLSCIYETVEAQSLKRGMYLSNKNTKTALVSSGSGTFQKFLQYTCTWFLNLAVLSFETSQTNGLSS